MGNQYSQSTIDSADQASFAFQSFEAIIMDEDKAHVPINLEAGIHGAYNQVEQAIRFVPLATVHRLLGESLDDWYRRRKFEIAYLPPLRHDPQYYAAKSDLQVLDRKVDSLTKAFNQRIQTMESKISRKLNDLVALGRKNQSLVETVDRKINALEDSIDMKIEGKFERTMKANLEISPVRKQEASKTQREQNEERKKRQKESTARKQRREAQKEEHERTLVQSRQAISVMVADKAKMEQAKKDWQSERERRWQESAERKKRRARQEIQASKMQENAQLAARKSKIDEISRQYHQVSLPGQR